jgi:hypothetical protein
MASTALLCCFCKNASAQNMSTSIATVEVRPKPVILLIDPAPKDDYSFRKTNYNKTVSIMLYGFRDQPDTPVIQKSRKNLGSFFKQHIDRIKEDFFSKDPEGLHLVTGERAFNSTEINRGINVEPAKMAGFTAPIGNLTFGGGYTWGEKNPALMRLTKANGFFSGVSYDTNKVGFQLSYLKSGDKVAGLKVSGSKIPYQSFMLGTSFKVTERMGMTATVQYRTDQDQLTTGDRQMIFTVGTKWKF